MILSIIFFILASICNACMDTLVHHWYKSIFKDFKNPNFWNPELSSSQAPYIPHTKYKVDAWHLFKSTMIILLALSVLTFNYSGNILSYGILLIAYGFAWNLPFNLFYNKLLIKK